MRPPAGRRLFEISTDVVDGETRLHLLQQSPGSGETPAAFLLETWLGFANPVGAGMKLGHYIGFGRGPKKWGGSTI